MCLTTVDERSTCLLVQFCVKKSIQWEKEVVYRQNMIKNTFYSGSQRVHRGSDTRLDSPIIHKRVSFE